MKSHFTKDDDILWDALALESDMSAENDVKKPSQEARLCAGFYDIQSFVRANARLPSKDTRDIFEKIYAIRLERIRSMTQSHVHLKENDCQNLLGGNPQLNKTLTTTSKKPFQAENTRLICQNFQKFKSVFEHLHRDLKLGVREARLIREKYPLIEANNFFIWGGQKTYIAQKRNAFLNIIVEDGIEIHTSVRKFQCDLYNDSASKKISEPNIGTLFSKQLG